MTDIHKDLEGERFEQPSGIVTQTVCRTTGCLATTGCTDTYEEIFASNNLPEKCQGHGSQRICSESGKVATEYCSQYCTVRTNNYGSVIPKEELNLWEPVSGRKHNGTKIEEVCNIHTKPKEEPAVEEPKEDNNKTNTNKTNTTNSGNTNTNTSTNTSGNTVTPPEPVTPPEEETQPGGTEEPAETE